MGTEFSYEDAFPANNDEKSTNEFSYEDAYDIKPKRTIASTAKDTAISATKGVLGIPGMITGIADIAPALATGSRPFDKITDKIGEATGFQPSKWAESLDDSYSAVHKKSAADIGKVWEDPNTSGWDVAKEYAKNPGYIADQIVEALPSMAVGGVAARGLNIAGRAAQGGAGILERQLAKGAISKLGVEKGTQAAAQSAAAITGGAGEGLVQAGQAMDQATGEDQRKNAIAALGSGLIDAVIGAGAGKLAQKLGFETPETLMAKGFDKQVTDEVATGLAKFGKPGRMAGGALSEGILQELPQSAQEQVFANYAEGKPLWDGVNRAAVEGALAGFVMGAGANLLPGRSPADASQPVEQMQSAAPLPTPREDVIAPSGGIGQQPEPPLPNVPPQDLQPQDAFTPPQPAGPISKALRAVQPIEDQPSTIPTASPQAAQESRQQPPTVADSRLSETVDQLTGEILKRQQQKFDTSVPINNSARPYILQNFGEDVVRELSEAKRAGTPISIDQAQKNIAEREAAFNDHLATGDLMNDFADQAIYGQDREDAKLRKAKFEQLKRQNESKQATTQSDGSAGMEAVSNKQSGDSSASMPIGEHAAEPRIPADIPAAAVPRTDQGRTGDNRGSDEIKPGSEPRLVDNREQVREPGSDGDSFVQRNDLYSGGRQFQLTSEEQETLSRVNRADYWIKPNENNRPYFASLTEKGLIEYDEKTGSYGKVTNTVTNSPPDLSNDLPPQQANNTPDALTEGLSEKTVGHSASVNDPSGAPSGVTSSKESPPPGTAPAAVEAARSGEPTPTEQTATTSEQVATPEQLKSITITTEAFGKPQTMTAHEALTAIDDDIAIYDKIRGCLG